MTHHHTSNCSFCIFILDDRITTIYKLYNQWLYANVLKISKGTTCLFYCFMSYFLISIVKLFKKNKEYNIGR